jgi:hypothetical protein
MSRILIRLACAVLAIGLFVPTLTFAQPVDKRTYFTFSGPVSLPGVTLPAGKYLFRVVDTATRNVVQILSEDGKKSYALFFAVHAERVDIAPAPEVRFLETAAGTASAIKTWWYPGERGGYEFIYPKRQARQLARESGTPVLTTKPETVTPPETRTAELSRIAPSGEPAPSAPEVLAPTPGPTITGEVAPSEVTVSEVQPREALPKTASAMPMLTLLCLTLLVGGWVLKGWRLSRS